MLAATGGGDSIGVWQMSDDKEIRIVSYPNKLCHVLFRPDGSKLLATGHAGIKVWETKTGLEVKHFLAGETFYLLEWLNHKTLAARTGGYLFHVYSAPGDLVPNKSRPGGPPQHAASSPAH